MPASKHLRVVRPACPESRRTSRTRVFPSAFGLVRVSFSGHLVVWSLGDACFLSQLAPSLASWLARWHRRNYPMCVFLISVLSVHVFQIIFFRDIIRCRLTRVGLGVFGIKMTRVQIANVATVALCQLKR